MIVKALKIYYFKDDDGTLTFFSFSTKKCTKYVLILYIVDQTNLRLKQKISRDNTQNREYQQRVDLTNLNTTKCVKQVV